MDEYIKNEAIFKKQLDKRQIIKKRDTEYHRKKQSICDINNSSSLARAIKNLPNELQKKIYVFGIKDYWKNIILEKSLKPLWQDHFDYVNREKDKIFLKNIHFMHLEFNTRPEYKQYISGCRCDYCISYPQEDKDNIYNYINHQIERFHETIEITDVSPWGTGLLPKNWFNYSEEVCVNDFFFMKGDFEDPLNYSPQEAPLRFSYELTKI